jgi:ubiquinone/menaquinone biosynthesis C-methylase UbiE
MEGIMELSQKDWDFDSWAETYDVSVQDNDWIHENYAKNIDLLVYEINNIVKDKKMSLLDIGAGTGTLISKLSKNQNINISAIEPSKKMREIFTKKCPDIEIIDGCLPRLPILKKKFDIIVSSYVIHHITHDKSLLMAQNIKNLLKPNGTLLLIDVMFNNKEYLESEVHFLKQQGLINRVEEILDEYFYFVESLSIIFENEGFSVYSNKLSKYVWYIKAILCSKCI